jgi:hypothetical protein
VTTGPHCWADKSLLGAEALSEAMQYRESRYMGISVELQTVARK